MQCGGGPDGWFSAVLVAAAVALLADVATCTVSYPQVDICGQSTTLTVSQDSSMSETSAAEIVSHTAVGLSATSRSQTCTLTISADSGIYTLAFVLGNIDEALPNSLTVSLDGGSAETVDIGEEYTASRTIELTYDSEYAEAQAQGTNQNAIKRNTLSQPSTHAHAHTHAHTRTHTHTHI